MDRLSTFFPRAVRWQQPLAIILVLSAMLTASTPASSDAECEDLDDLLADPAVTYTAPSGEKVVQLNSALGTDVLKLCARRPEQSNPVLGVRFEVARSNVQLDCGGVVFDGGQFVPGNQNRVVSALSFQPHVSPAMHDVVVSNCVFEKYLEGIRVIAAGINDVPEKGLTNITLQDVVLRDIAGTAVIIGPHNRDNLLERVEITGAYSYGVHLQPYSSRTTIREGYFAENGWPGNISHDGHEAIAIDSSSHNVITDSYFYHNKYAGIALYKNCGQDATSRKEGANYNTIERNEFFKHDHPNALTRGGAIVIASRQGLDLADSKDVFSGTCSDASHKTPVGTRYRDIARHNIVRRNSFAFNLTAIRVRDSFNRIEGNTFTGDTWTGADGVAKKSRYGVVADARLLKDIGEPATGITVIDNVTLTKTDPVGQNFVKLYDATMLFANNVDRSYKCVTDSLALGNRCNPATLTDPAPGAEPDAVIPLVDPLDRCEVVMDRCPARNVWLGFSNFPAYWLDTLYGANILPHRCEERAQGIWEWCKVHLNDVFKVTTTAVIDGYRAEPTSYEGP